MIIRLKNDYSRLRYLIIPLFLLLFVNSFHIVNIPQNLILLLAIIIPFFLERGEIAAYVICFSMIGTGIQVAYICLSCAVNLVMKNNFKVSKSSVYVTACFIVNEIIRVVIYPDDSFVEIIRYACVYFLIVLVLSLELTQTERKKIVDACIFSTACVAIMILIETVSLSNWSIMRLSSGALRLGYSEQLGGQLFFSADPNMLGQSCALAISLCLMFIYSEGPRIKYLLPLIVCIVCGTFTVSKTFILSLVILFVLFLLGVGYKGNIVKSFLQKCGLLIIVALLVYIIFRVNPNYIENLMDRVDNSNITTGRVDNALTYVAALSSNTMELLFGVGIQNVGSKIGFTGSPHAALVEMVVCWGVIGAIIICLLILASIRWHAKFNDKIRFANIIPFLVFSFVVQTTQLFRLRDHVLCLIVVIVVFGLRLGKGGENEEKSITSN